MKKIFSIMLLLTILISAQTYQQSWEEVTKLDKKNLPKSALKKVEAIYQKAIQEQNDIEILHSILEKMRYKSMLEENGDRVAIEFLEKELKKSYSTPNRLIIKSVLAKLYDNYQKEHIYTISSRTNIKDDNNTDIATWTIDRLNSRARRLYLDSIGDEAKYIDIQKYKPILNRAKNTDKLEPTLYDFLVFRALEYFRGQQNNRDSFVINNPIAFGDIYSFINHQFSNSAMLLYQKLLRFHWEKGDKLALQHANISRLEFVYNHFIGKDKDRYYLNSLEQIKSRNIEAILYLAQYYNDKKEYKKAIAYANQGIKSPNKYVSTRCQNIKNRIVAKQINIELENINLPHNNILTKVEYRNMDKLFVKVIKITDKISKQLNHIHKNRLNYINTLPTIKQFDIPLPKTDDYKQHTTEVSLGSYDLGYYLIVISKDKNFSDKRLIIRREHISNIGYFFRNSSFLVVNRVSGKPMSGVTATLYHKYKPIATYESNSEGLINIPKDSANFSISFQKDNDILKLNDIYYSNNYSPNRYTRTEQKVIIFTDRAIYRPSQKIYFKGLAVETFPHQKPKILTNKSISLSLYNTNDQKIKTQEFKTDEFGTFHGYFIAPKTGQLGRMSLGVDNMGYKNIRVEEYKRPKFEVNFEQVAQTYRLGDKVTITGEAKALSGYGLSGAKVKYSIKRVASFPWRDWWRPTKNYPSKIVASSEITTDANGKFSISFDAIADPNISAEDKPNFSYIVSVDVTDTTGETHSNNKTINIGYVAIKADMIIEREIDINSNSGIKLVTTNLDNKFQPLQGRVVIEKFKPKAKVYRDRYWSPKSIDKPLYSQEQFKTLFPNYQYPNFEEKTDIIKTINFDTAKSKTIKLEGLEQGRYKFTLYTTDKYGTEVKKSIRDIVIYNLEDKNPPVTTNLWFKTDKKSYKVGNSAKLILKSSTPNSWVRLEIHRDNNYKEEWIEFNKLSQKIIEITKQDRGNIPYRLTMVKNNRKYQYQGTIAVPWKNRLKVEFITFRDKLKPNTKEQWRIKISGEDKEKVMAQMVATMYDASLDKFTPHKFNMPNIFPYQTYLYNQWYAKDFGTIRGYAGWKNYTTEYSRVFYSLKNRYNFINMYGKGGDILLEAMPSPEMLTSARLVHTPAPQAMVSEEDKRNLVSSPYTEPTPKQPIHIRNNLKETMFFKPDLQTDANGNIIINFKTNDALTRWNFLAFVHTKELQSAVVKKVITTQKELMVVTNLPRFFREGDKIKLTEKIVNLSDRDLKGECELKLTNPINGWSIYGNHKFIKPFHIKKGGSTTVTFYIRVPTVDTIPAIEHTVIARTQTHTDAEQMIKPILTNREFVTESKALWLRGNESRTFTLQSLKDNNSTTLKNHKLIVEFTSNPVWYAIKSLPYLIEYPHECNEQLFSRYFANALASNIINKHPKIKKLFDSWRAKGNLKSPLSTNQELKSVMLEETPWLITAQSEEQQQKNIALLFDLDRVAQEKKETLNRLFERQNSDGGWSWFSGGKSNWYITQYILEGFGKLHSLGIKHKPLRKAIRYIDNQMLKEYNRLLKDIEKGYTKLEDDHLSNIIIHYLYTREFYNQKMNDEVKKAYNYYLNQAKKYALTKGLYQQALLAIALNKTQNSKEAQAIIQSLKENAIEDKELGMYFKYHRGYYWYQAPIETQSIMIEAFDQVAHDKKSVEELKVWLLKNKQTTHWRTTKATVNAIYALLINDSWLENDKLIDISFDTKMNYKPIIEKAKKEAEKGTGYFKATFNKFTKSMATIKATNPNSNIAWGGLYWQYFENMDKIKSFKETPLTIDKKLYMYDTLQSNQLIPITDQTLKVGDKIISRIEIRVDRDMEFVMLKDGRASAFEPINVLSQYKWQDGLGYYESTKDSATYFFFDYLPKGTYVFEYPLVVTHHGEFSNGIATIESMYAPEFRSHSEGVRVFVP